MRHRSQAGSVLVAVLWCLVLISVVVIGVLHASRMDLLAGRNHADKIQARYLALAGVEKAKAVLFHNARERSRSRVHHEARFFSDCQEFRETPFGRGRFSVLREAGSEQGGGIIHAVLDEESLLNINSADTNSLSRLESMTPDLVSAIVDWRDPDNSAGPAGAEEDYYASLVPPRQPRNAPLQSIEEMLMIRGVTPDLLYGRGGSARNTRTGGSGSLPWIEVLTAHSGVENINAAGQERVELKSADEKALTGISGITPEIARAIIAHRDRNNLNSLGDLLDVAPAPSGQGGRSSPVLPGSNPGGRVISEELFQEIADEVSIEGSGLQPGLINLNSAGIAVLSCLPGLTREIANAILLHRQSSGSFRSIAGLLKVPGVSRDIFKQIAPLVTVRSETFRIMGEGKVDSSGARQRVQVIVRIGLQEVTTLHYREHDL